jgi:ATP-dependent exoDNAse (exonuclease V) alpha subunit
LYERRSYLTEVYRNALSREVRALGYEIENRRDVAGKDKGFKIAGVSQEILDNYSRRSAQRDAAIEEFTQKRGRAPTDNEVAVLIRETRADKLQEISTEQVHCRQLERLTLDQRHMLGSLREEAIKQSSPLQLDHRVAYASLGHAQEHVFERLSVAKEQERTSGNLVGAGDEIATQASLLRERDMVAVVNRGLDRYDRLGNSKHFEPAPQLRDEQRRAVEMVLDSTDLAVNVRGAAGTGKTATLREIDRGLRENGTQLVAVAPTRSAVDELQKVGFRDAMTVSRLLEDQESQRTLAGRVMIVDEAGMVSGKQMQSILHLAEDHGARIIFSGDTRQIRSVEASDALRILETESGLKSISLTGVQRQTNPEYREAIKMMRSSPEEGFGKLEELGAIREVHIFDRSQAVADLHREFRMKGQDTLVVAGTHEEIAHINEAVRQDRKEHGELGTGRHFDTYVSLQWTAAQKQDLSNYQEGLVLQFQRNTKLAGRHESLEVARVGPESLVARKSTGEEIAISPTQVRAFSVYERRSIEVAPGDSLMLTANRRDSDFRATNGELVKVKSIGEAAIRLEDGRTIPANYREFAHGYAITAHRSQGKTVDNVIISADAMKKESFYVAASRGRCEIAVVTSDRELLRESIGVSTARQSAMELVRKQQHEHGLDKAPEMSHKSGFAGNHQTHIGEHHSTPAPMHDTGRTADHGIEQDIGHSLGL